jgi:hypothetical protein
MGTYLSLELKNGTNKNIHAVNDLWNSENVGFENTLHFNTKEDIQADVDAIQSDPRQEHLRYIKTVQDWNENFSLWAQGCFQVKLTLGDYLCSEMARRYIAFLNKHRDLFVEFPSDYEMEVLQEAAVEEHKATSCLVECPYCKSVLEVESAG